MSEGQDAFKLKLLMEAQHGSQRKAPSMLLAPPPSSRMRRQQAVSTPQLNRVDYEPPSSAASGKRSQNALSSSANLTRAFGSCDDLHSTYPPAKPMGGQSAMRTESSKPQRVPSTAAMHRAESVAVSQPPRRVQPSTYGRQSPQGSSSNMPRRVPQSRTPTLRTPSSSAPSSPRLPRPSTASTHSAISEAITDILTRSASTDWAQRNEAVSLVRNILAADSRPTSREIKKLADYFIRHFAEPHKKVFVAVIDGLSEFVLRFADELPDTWLYDTLAGLLLKLGTDQPPSTFSVVCLCAR